MDVVTTIGVTLCVIRMYCKYNARMNESSGVVLLLRAVAMPGRQFVLLLGRYNHFIEIAILEIISIW